jgi:hypothetical protein
VSGVNGFQWEACDENQMLSGISHTEIAINNKEVEVNVFKV